MPIEHFVTRSGRRIAEPDTDQAGSEALIRTVSRYTDGTAIDRPQLCVSIGHAGGPEKARAVAELLDRRGYQPPEEPMTRTEFVAAFPDPAERQRPTIRALNIGRKPMPITLSGIFRMRARSRIAEQLSAGYKRFSSAPIRIPVLPVRGATIASLRSIRPTSWSFSTAGHPSAIERKIMSTIDVYYEGPNNQINFLGTHSVLQAIEIFWPGDADSLRENRLGELSHVHAGLFHGKGRHVYRANARGQIVFVQRRI